MLLVSKLYFIELKIEAGRGGNGIVSFRKEKFIPCGGPYGGDGGMGGNVWIVAGKNVENLEHFKNRRLFKAENGGAGGSNRKRGHDGRDEEIKVPVGTAVYLCNDEQRFLVELGKVDERVMVARGGRGGHGNAYFTSAENQAPRIYQRGEKGKSVTIKLEYVPRIDVGIVGKPNAGKSALLSRLTGVNVKVADYPFTTTEPEIGTLIYDNERLVIAEIPAIIKGSSAGRGLGSEFIKYLEKAKLIVILIDASEDLIRDYEEITGELISVNPSIKDINRLVILSKVDSLDDITKSEIISKLAKLDPAPLLISALSNEGIEELIERVKKIIRKSEKKKCVEAVEGVVTLTPRGISYIDIHKEGNMFLINSADAEYLLETMDYDDREMRKYIIQKLRRKGLLRAFKNAGIKTGDRLKVGAKEIIWEWE